MKYISCRINGQNKRLKVEDRRIPEAHGKWPKNSHDKIPTQPGNVWPWRYMIPGECVRIPYNLANYYQIENSIKGFSKNRNDVKFRYRSGALCLSVWCISKGDKKDE